MGPVLSIKTCLRKYATFSGRASRSEFWWFALFSGCTLFLSAQIDSGIFGTNEWITRERPLEYSDLIVTSRVQTSFAHPLHGSIFLVALGLIAIPFYTVASRRLADAGDRIKTLRTPLIMTVAFPFFLAGTYVMLLKLGAGYAVPGLLFLIFLPYVGIISFLHLKLLISLLKPTLTSIISGPNPHEVSP